MPTETLRSVLTQGAQRYLDSEITATEFEQGLVMAIAESPYDKQKLEDLHWLAIKIITEQGSL